MTIKKLILLALTSFATVVCSAAETKLADAPVETSSQNIAPNMMLALSVEWPTGVVAAYKTAYSDSERYLGYFDPERCYSYYYGRGASVYKTPDQPSASGTRGPTRAATEYFAPSGSGSGTNKHTCSGAFSGNYLNWAAMHALDGFRFAMTGGDRVIDETALTVVEKARHTGIGGTDQFPIKTYTSPSAVTPFSSWSTVYARVTNGTTELNPFSDTATRGRVIQISNNSSFSHGGKNITYTFLVRVKVCDANAAGGLEYSSSGDYAMCAAYGSGYYKPVGIIQKNASQMRFGVTAYLLDSSSDRAGGVVRARLKSVGPYYAGTSTANPYKEWDSTTGIYIAHPDQAMLTSAETNNGAVTQSGVINYLNKFGKANGYKSYDPMSEMYYAALRSIRNMTPNVSNYTSNLTSDMYDGFPVFKTTADESNEYLRPIQHYCQKNNIITIADSNTHTDVDVPGNTLQGYSGHPYRGVTDDSAIDIGTIEKKLGKIEANNEYKFYYYGPGRSNTYHVSALAYWANTTDILPDDSSKPWTTGSQNVKSYFVDVQEVGSDGNSTFDANGVPTVKNQMFYGAKWGGFDTTGGDTAFTTTSTWGNSYGFPNNLFYGSSPAKMIAALNSIVNSVLASAGTRASTTISSSIFTGDSAGVGSYNVSFNPANWTGDVIGYLTALDASGNAVRTKKWNAQPLLDTLVTGTGWDTARKVITYNGTAGQAFRAANLTAAQQAALTPASSGASLQNVVDYLRGDATYEGAYFRTRTSKLGDIVDSEATVVGAPGAAYSGDTGYAAFRTTHASRKTVVYAGANDGMLHAFDGDVGTASTSPSSTAGQELWAYIPSFVYSGPTGTASEAGLIVRTQLSGFAHKYYVNATPVSADVDFKNTKDDQSKGDWRTILVGGLGKGGKGFYAIDVSNPAEWTSESAVAGKVLWEFKDEDMGYSYGKPIIVKTAEDGWVVLFSSGYNNTTGSNPGKGFLYVVNAKTGALIEKIGTGSGSAASPSGLAQLNAFIPVKSSYTVDYVYAGDLNGDFWRFDLRARTNGRYAVTKIAQFKDASGVAQPVSVSPQTDTSNSAGKRWVYVATGKMLHADDLDSTQTQSIYAMRDGTKNSVYGSSDGETAIPTGAFPTLRAQMVERANLTSAWVSTSAQPMGWYYDMPSPQQAGKNFILAGGVVTFFSYTGSSDDPCSSSVSSTLYGFSALDGVSILEEDGALLNSIGYTDQSIAAVIYTDSAGNLHIGTTSESGDLANTKVKDPYARKAKLNWREIVNSQ